MKSILIAACILGMAVCAPLSHLPQPQLYMEFDIHHAPAEAILAIPAGVPADALDVLLPVDAQRRVLPGPVRGFIKQEVPNPNGIGTKDVYIPFGFDPAAAPAAPAAPASPVDTIVPASPVDTIVPIGPGDTIVPIAPGDTIVPVAPAVPVYPGDTIVPIAPVEPVVPAAPVVPVVAANVPAVSPLGDDDDDDD